MKTKAVRLYGKNDLRLEEFNLPPLKKDEILAEIITDSLCTSSYKASILGNKHKRIPNDVHKNPIIIGHEFCGKILQVGKKWQKKFRAGSKFTIQPALNYKGSLNAPGYSFKYIGGNATHVIIPNVVMEQNCLLSYTGKGFFQGSLSEPVSCVVGAFNSMYHIPQGTYTHVMGIKKNSNLAILAGTGPMGLVAIDYCINGPINPSQVVITSRNLDKLNMAKKMFSVTAAKKKNIKLIYIHTNEKQDVTKKLLNINPKKYDDVFVMAADKNLIKTADAILAKDGCLNFFAGPTDTNFCAPFNFYNVHYNFTHITSNSGGNTDDMKAALKLMSKNILNPATIITHIGGLNSVVETTKKLPHIGGGKKLIYTQKNIPLTAIQNFAEIGKKENSNFFTELAKITRKNNNLWSLEAEQYVLKNAKNI